jgi:hypothetical protein
LLGDAAHDVAMTVLQIVLQGCGQGLDAVCAGVGE